MRKKIMAVVLSCLTIFALVASSFAVTFPRLPFPWTK